jgi:glyoxylase-like metal-dependent hydrolase (beta-lactamase superfamily II)
MIPLEDQYTDVLGKARRGLRLSESQLAQKAGVGLEAVEAFQQGKLDDADSIARITRALDLYAPALLDLARGEWTPEGVELPPTVAAYNVPFGDDMTVNFYLAWDRDGGRAAAFDTGGNCLPMLQTLREKRLTLDAIFLTHTHEDHVADLDRLLAETDAPVYVSRLEAIGGATLIGDGQSFTVGALTITARLTPGHSPGGTTYVIAGLEPGVAVVGDALFAASMGGVSPEKYAAALEANRANILALPEETVICPGHGPVTTVGLEKKHNPFYAAGVAKA